MESNASRRLASWALSGPKKACEKSPRSTLDSDVGKTICFRRLLLLTVAPFAHVDSLCSRRLTLLKVTLFAHADSLCSRCLLFLLLAFLCSR